MEETLLDVIRRRRTIRRFTDQKVSEEQIDTLLELAMCAPSRLDRRPWHFIVIRDKGLQKQLAGLLRVHPYLEQASALVVVCGEPKSSPTWTMDVSASIENLVLGATAMGLGSAWVGSPGTVLWDMCDELLHDLLAIPLDVGVVALVALGHPAEERSAHGKHDRLEPLKVHFDHWEIRERA
jgi:nitroreductase